MNHIHHLPDRMSGVPVYPDKYLTITEEYRKPLPANRITRLWEKLRRWWDPHQAIGYRQIPDPNLYMISGIGIVGHPETIERLKRELDRRNNEQSAEKHGE